MHGFQKYSAPKYTYIFIPFPTDVFKYPCMGRGSGCGHSFFSLLVFSHWNKGWHQLLNEDNGGWIRGIRSKQKLNIQLQE